MGSKAWGLRFRLCFMLDWKQVNVYSSYKLRKEKEDVLLHLGTLAKLFELLFTWDLAPTVYKASSRVKAL